MESAQIIAIVQIIASVAQILSLIWCFIFGALTIVDVIKKAQRHLLNPAVQKATFRFSYIVNVILSLLALTLSLYILHSPQVIRGGGGAGQQRSTPTTTIVTLTPTATALPTSTQVIGNDPLIINDPLISQDALQWDEYPNAQTGACVFRSNAYHAIATPRNSTSCLATQTNSSDLALQADMNIISGNNGGIIFRSNQKEDSFYAFSITTSGSYFLIKSSPSSDVQTYTTLSSGQSSEIRHGINQLNVLTVITHGATFSFYVNTHYVGRASDESYTSGMVGVFTNAGNENVTEEVAFTNFKVWGGVK